MYTVMIVDDEKHCIIDLEKSISWETFGFRIVATFRDPKEAESAILSFSPDVVFTDIRMPKYSGMELIKNTKEMGYKGVFVIVSGYDDFKYTKEAIKEKVYDYCLKPIDEEEVTGLLFSIKKKLLDNKKSNEIADNSHGGILLNQIIEYIKLNLNKKITINEVLEHFHISKAYMTKLFLKYVNMSFTKYVNEMRMDCACRLLRETDFSIQEIASKVGIEDYFYFTKKFKQYNSVTPTNYRRGFNDEE